jgi:hypothetical protein
MLFRATQGEGEHGVGDCLWGVQPKLEGGVLVRHYLLRDLEGEVRKNLQKMSRFTD